MDFDSARLIAFRRTAEQFMGFESKFDECTVVLEPMTKNTFLLLISVDPRIGTVIIRHSSAEGSRNRDAPVYHPSITTTPLRVCDESGTRPEMRVSGSLRDHSPNIFRLCRHNTELDYEVKGDDDPEVPAWDDAGNDLDLV